MPILTDVTYTNLTANFNLTASSNQNIGIDLRSPLLVNAAIDIIAAQMVDQGWTPISEYPASTTFHVPGLIGTSIVGFSKITTNWYGLTLQFYTSPEANPTGAPGLVPGTFIHGMLANSGDSQAELIGLLAITMQSTCIDPFIISVSGVDTISIIGEPGHGPSLNDRFYGANVTAGYSFSGPTNGGGWELTSLATAEHSPVTVSIRKKDSRNYLSIDAVIDGNPCTEILIERRHNYLSVVSPYMWCLFRRNDGTTYSSGDIFVQYDNYLICAPEMDITQRDADPPMTNAAFVMIGDRTQINQSITVVTCINGDFQESGFSAFNNDLGVTFYLFNSMLDSAGALTTTADKYLTFAALAGLSTASEPGLRLVGPCWDMFTTTKYAALDTLAFGPTGKLVIAYRSQEAPCEATLWLALN